MLSLQAKWQHLSCVVPGAKAYLQPINDAIWVKLILALIGLTVAEVGNNMRPICQQHNAVRPEPPQPCGLGAVPPPEILRRKRRAGEVAEGGR